MVIGNGITVVGKHTLGAHRERLGQMEMRPVRRHSWHRRCREKTAEKTAAAKIRTDNLAGIVNTSRFYTANGRIVWATEYVVRTVPIDDHGAIVCTNNLIEVVDASGSKIRKIQVCVHSSAIEIGMGHGVGIEIGADDLS